MDNTPVHPLIPRVAALLVAALVTFLKLKLGYEISDPAIRELTDLLTFVGSYALTHRTLSSKLNPADAATKPPINDQD